MQLEPLPESRRSGSARDAASKSQKPSTAPFRARLELSSLSRGQCIAYGRIVPLFQLRHEFRS